MIKVSKSKKKLFVVAVVIFVLIATVSVFFVKRNVVGFDVRGVVERDCVPYNVFVSKGSTEYSANISWSTKADCVGFVLYGRDRGNLDMVAVDLVNKSSSKEHVVNLDQLLPSEVYYFLINSQEQSYGNNGIPLEFVLKNL